MDNPVIDTKDIFVDVEPLPEFDVKVQVRMPSHCIQKITTRLIEGGLEQTDQQLVQILLKVSVDEAFSRLERQPLWGPAFVNTKPPSLPLESEDFTFEFIVDQIPIFNSLHLRVWRSKGLAWISQKILLILNCTPNPLNWVNTKLTLDASKQIIV